jgi:H+/Cl- antiporter ClcA
VALVAAAQVKRKKWSRRIKVGGKAGLRAGIAAAFNTPLHGIMSAIEKLHSRHVF